MKQKVIGGDFDATRYISSRVFAPSRDGKQIPLSIVHKKELKKDGSNPTLIYAYGDYGDNINTYFEQEVISLLDRGFIYVVANVRGGSEMGQQWYEDGKMLNKKNTFYDFIDVTNFLISNNSAIFHVAMQSSRLYFRIQASLFDLRLLISTDLFHCLHQSNALAPLLPL